MKRNILPILILSFSAIIIALNGCSSTKKSMKPESTGHNVEDILKDNERVYSLVEFNDDGVSISKLDDLYSSNQNEIPDEYSKLKNSENEFVDLTQGFRIQIYSGEDLALADSIAGRFRVWVSDSIEGYKAEVYTIFKSPYYRVHVGDFHKREEALSYTRLVKRAFGDAWVVYDTIDPDLVPEDEDSFNLK